MNKPIVKSVSEAFDRGARRAIVVLEIDLVDIELMLGGLDTSELPEAGLRQIFDHADAESAIAAARATGATDPRQPAQQPATAAAPVAEEHAK